MKKKIALTVVFCIIITTMFLITGLTANDSKAEENVVQQVSYVDAQVTASGVNLRDGASLKNKVTCVLDKGTEVKILGKLGNWLALYVPSKEVVGVADSKYFKSSTEIAVNSDSTLVSAKVAAASKNENKDEKSILKIDKEKQAMVDLINNERKSAGLDPLVIDETLDKIASVKAKDIEVNKYFAHKSPTYGSPFDLMKRSGIVFKSAGENLAGNQSFEEALKGWMENDEHKVNILNANYKYVGIGIADNEKYGKVFVADFIEK